MKKTAMIIFTLVACTGMVFATTPLTTNNIQVVISAKDAALTHGVNTPGLPVGGDNIGLATVIPGVPYLDAGTTSGFTNDYDEVCPYSGSTSPDVVYAFTPTSDMSVDISLCSDGNQYDTKLYVYANSVGNLVACNDDYCANSWTSYASFLECIPLSADVTYYIVIDGYGGSFGAYELSVTQCFPPEPCQTVCPPGSFSDDEPDCYDGYADATNNGCNGPVPHFTDIPCDHDPKVVCGTAGNYLYNGLSYRDMDWYTISWPGGTLTAGLCATFDSYCWILAAGCPVVTVYASGGAAANEEIVLAANLPAGQYIIIAAPAGWNMTPCGSPYVLTLNGCPGTATEKSTWGGLKGLFH